MENNLIKKKLHVIELIGMPCSGKTTLVENLEKRMETQGLYCPTVRDVRELRKIGFTQKTEIKNTADFLIFLTKNPNLIKKCVSFFNSYGKFPQSFYRIRTLLKAFHTVEIAFTKGYDVILLEEGIFQMAWSCGYPDWHGNPESFKHLIELTDDMLYDLYFVDTDLKTVQHRMARRQNKGRYRGLEYDWNFAQQTSRSLKKLINFIAEHKNNLFILDGSNLNENVTLITDRAKPNNGSSI